MATATLIIIVTGVVVCIAQEGVSLLSGSGPEFTLEKGLLRKGNKPGGTERATSASKHATSAAAELGGEIHNVSRNRAHTQVLLQAQKLRVYGRDTLGAFWDYPDVAPLSSEKGAKSKGSDNS